MLARQYSIRAFRPLQKAAEFSARECYLAFQHSTLETAYSTPASDAVKLRALRERPQYDSFLARIQQYLRGSDDDRLNAELWGAIMSDVCARPERSVIMQVSHPDGILVHSYIHFRYGWAVENVTYGQYSRATLFRTHETLIEHIENLWGLSNLHTPGEGEGSVSEAELRRARVACFAGNPPLAAKILSKAGLPERLAQRFGNTLANPLLDASAICVSSSPSHSLAIVGGPEGVWLLEPYQEDGDLKVRILPTNASQVSQKLSALLQR